MTEVTGETNTLAELLSVGMWEIDPVHSNVEFVVRHMFTTLTQAQVAHQLGMRRPSISEIEWGRRHVKADELQAMATLYRVSARLLMYGAGPKDGQLVELVAEELAHLTDADLDRLSRALEIVKRRGR